MDMDMDMHTRAASHVHPLTRTARAPGLRTQALVAMGYAAYYATLWGHAAPPFVGWVVVRVRVRVPLPHDVLHALC